jgi:hypothetical protein
MHHDGATDWDASRSRSATAKDAGFSEEPLPDTVLLRAERCRHQPESFASLGLVRVRFRMRSGAWRYETVPVDAVVG